MTECTHPRSKGAKRCRSCNCKAMWADPDFRARKARSNAATLEKLRQDPAFIERERKRQVDGLQIMLERGTQHTPEAIAKRARTFTARRLSWCPPHLRREYIRLMTNKHLPASEAREVILNQWRTEMQRRNNAARAA
ncbi:hypothetical protein [Sphingobium yanoikuyae]|nr:hypothetical protein [Sphingobium yanoikuyae]